MRARGQEAESEKGEVTENRAEKKNHEEVRSDGEVDQRSDSTAGLAKTADGIDQEGYRRHPSRHGWTVQAEELSELSELSELEELEEIESMQNAGSMETEEVRESESED